MCLLWGFFGSCKEISILIKKIYIAYFLFREHFHTHTFSCFSSVHFFFIRTLKWQSHIKNTWGMHKNNINLLYKGCSKNCLVSFIIFYIFSKVIPPQDKLNNNFDFFAWFLFKKSMKCWLFLNIESKIKIFQVQFGSFLLSIFFFISIL